MNILFTYDENVSFLNSGDKYNKFPLKNGSESFAQRLIIPSAAEV